MRALEETLGILRGPTRVLEHVISTSLGRVTLHTFLLLVMCYYVCIVPAQGQDCCFQAMGRGSLSCGLQEEQTAEKEHGFPFWRNQKIARDV
jgi:hypothetical protein